MRFGRGRALLVPVRRGREHSRDGGRPRTWRRPLKEGSPRVVALDYGRRRIGVAVSDPTGTIASPRGTIERGRGAKGHATRPPEELLRLIEEVRPSRILVGIPLGMDGSAGEMAMETRRFAAALGLMTSVEIVEWDERLTTARAEREIQALGLRRSKRRQKGRSDEMAATLMLTDYLRSVSR